MVFKSQFWFIVLTKSNLYFNLSQFKVELASTSPIIFKRIRVLICVLKRIVVIIVYYTDNKLD